jgi:hypothetical protein
LEYIIPAVIAEGAVKADQSWIGLFIAPCVPPSDQLYLFQEASIHRVPESSHPGSVNPPFILVMIM